MSMKFNLSPVYKNGEPCNHTGCLNHSSHACEECGRINGQNKYKIELCVIDHIGNINFKNERVLTEDQVNKLINMFIGES